MTARAVAGSNTYIPSYEASAGLIEYTRAPGKFRLNGYVKTLRTKKDQGYYLKLDKDEPYRVVSENDYVWVDGADAPAGNGEKMDFDYVGYRTLRRAFPFNVGYKAVEQAEWQVLEAHARKTLTKAMTLRTVQTTALLSNTANWSGNTGEASGNWLTSAEADLFIQTDINTAMLAIEKATGGVGFDEDALCIVFSPTVARAIAKTPEYRAYIKGSPDALSALTDWRNPMRAYGLAPYLYGIKVCVENAVRVTTNKGGTQTRGYIWGDDYAAIVSRPDGMAGDENAAATDFSTIALRFYEELTVESKDDPDNRRHAGRVVEDYVATLQAPETGYLLTDLNASS